MKTFKTLAACTLIVPLTLGASAVYAQERTPDQERAQEQREMQRPADERRGAEGAQRQGMQQRGTAGQADKDRMDRTGPTAGTQHQSGGKATLTRAPANAFHVDWLMGKEINAQAGDDTIGTVNDVLIGEDGKVVAVIVGVGGLLGMGEREVAIPWDAIQHTRDEDGDSEFTTNMTQASLESAPEYDRDATSTTGRDAAGTRDRDTGTAPRY